MLPGHDRPSEKRKVGPLSWHPGRLFYRIRIHWSRRGERQSLPEADYAALSTAAHRTLAAPVIVIWDTLTTDMSAAMRQFTSAARTG